MLVVPAENSVEWSKSVLNLRCRICRRKGDAETMLLCDGCNRGYHSTCLKPAIDVIPKGDWFCYECKPEELPPKPRQKKRRLADEEDILDELDRSDSDDADDGGRGRRRGGSRRSHDTNTDADEVCATCSFGGELLTCGDCSDSYHLLCLNPPLSRPPRGAWQCSNCKPGANKARSSSSTKKKTKVNKRDEEDDEDTGRSEADDDSRRANDSGMTPFFKKS